MSRKDKPSMKTSMESIVKKQADKELKAKGKILVGSSGSDVDLSKLKNAASPMVNVGKDLRLEKLHKEYNEKIWEFNPKYTGIKPVSKILIRCFLLEYERNEATGILIPPKVQVSVPTQNGLGSLYEVESPWPYAQLGVIIAAPERYKDTYKIGDIALIGTPHIKANIKGKDQDFNFPSAFTHYEWNKNHVLPPKDIENEHYGYVLVPPLDIDVMYPKPE